MMVRRSPLAKYGSNSPKRRPRSPQRWTSTEASALTGGYFPSPTKATWIVVVREVFRSDFGRNDPTEMRKAAMDEGRYPPAAVAERHHHRGFSPNCHSRHVRIGSWPC